MEPAEENRANEALVRFLSKKLKIKTICIASGMRARNKVLDFGNDFTIEQKLDRLLRKRIFRLGTKIKPMEEHWSHRML
jgi:uncharacterized protein YggU (UPF0235/DUF167 family)